MDKFLVQDLTHLYHPQSGGGLQGLQYYHSTYRKQRGAGLGSILGAIGRRLIPLARNILWPAAKKYILPHATSAAQHVASDILSGRNVKESIKEHGKGALKGIGEKILTQSGSGRSRRRTKPKKRKIKSKLKQANKKLKSLTLF